MWTADSDRSGTGSVGWSLDILALSRSRHAWAFRAVGLAGVGSGSCPSSSRRTDVFSRAHGSLAALPSSQPSCPDWPPPDQVSFEVPDLLENVRATMVAVSNHKPEVVKGTYIKQVSSGRTGRKERGGMPERFSSPRALALVLRALGLLTRERSRLLVCTLRRGLVSDDARRGSGTHHDLGHRRRGRGQPMGRGWLRLPCLSGRVITDSIGSD